MSWIEYLKVALLGVIEGITEWLPISSTGHMIIADQFLKLNMSDAFKEMFLVVIQLGAILAVVLLFWKRLFPFESQGKNIAVKKDVLILWVKIVIACVPAGIIGLLFDDEIEEIFFNYKTVAATLIIYGILFILIEAMNKNRRPRVTKLSQVTPKTALVIGVFQLLALLPGTSRSGATIVGAMLVGTSRTVASEFTFILAVPVMLGASFVKILKFGLAFTGPEIAALLLGMFVAFAVSVFAIKFLMGYVRKHDFRVFGWYRIVLGILIIIIFTILQ